LVREPHSGGDFVCVCALGLSDEAVDGCVDIDNGLEDHATRGAVWRVWHEALDGIERQAAGQCEVEDEARMTGGQLLHLALQQPKVRRQAA
jgi:hypothetical protein